MQEILDVAKSNGVDDPLFGVVRQLLRKAAVMDLVRRAAKPTVKSMLAKFKSWPRMAHASPVRS